MNKNWINGLLCALIMLAGLSGCAKKEEAVVWEESESAGTETTEDAGVAALPSGIMVDISGAVKNPGVYLLKEGARVCDAVEMAGGLSEDADVDALNQAAPLKDADKIRVYTKAETAGAPEAQQADTQKININTADVAQLCTLSGIGEARARDIIAYRETNGAFCSVEEIMKVSGIKEATFHKIEDKIAVW